MSTKVSADDDRLEFRKAKSPNRLIVEEALQDDNSVVGLHPLTMEKLDIFKYDTILIKGKRRRNTICTAVDDDTCDASKIRMNKVVIKSETEARRLSFCENLQ